MSLKFSVALALVLNLSACAFCVKMGIGTKTKALKVARAEMHCSSKSFWEIVPSGKLVSIVHVLLSGQ